jgi:ferredoxin-like protein FixX
MTPRRTAKLGVNAGLAKTCLTGFYQYENKKLIFNYEDWPECGTCHV